MSYKLLRPWLFLLFLVACGDSAEIFQPVGRQDALAEPERVVVALMGDFGVASTAEGQVARLIDGWSPDMIVTTGDNNYPYGAEATIDNNIGQFYHRYIRFGPQYHGRYRNQGASTQAFFPTLGNHDWATAGAAPYLRYFDLPGNKRYYRVRRGPVEFFMIDSDSREPDGVTYNSVQGKWLQAALQESTARWKLVAFHHPPYSTGTHGGSRYMRWPFKAWGATAVFNGHEHHYERIVQGDFPYVIVGTGGAPLRTASGRHPGAQLDVVYTRAHGALRIDADAREISAGFYNTRGAYIDGFTISAEQQAAARL